MTTSRHALLALSSLLLCLFANAATAQAPARQDPAALRQTAEQFLRIQTAGLPGKVDITVGQIDARTNLAACAAPEAFFPNGSRVWGKTTVGMRCREPASWTIYISATVRVTADYVVTAAPLAQGQMIAPNHLAKVNGDLTALPNGIVTDPAQAIGRTVGISLPAGTPLRGDSLRSQQAVLQGQSVRVVSSGPGFQVATEGRALNNAAEGQVAQAKTLSGQVVSGVAKAGGIVEVTY